MDKKEQNQHLQKTLSKDEYRKLVDAARITNGKDISFGMSASAAKKEMQKVLQLINHLTEHQDPYVKRTVTNIIRTAEINSSQGMFGDGIYLID
jgi:hypothetical protein